MNSGKRQAVVSFFLVIPFVLVSALVAQEKTAASHPSTHPTEARLVLREGWSLQTSAKVEAKPEVISTSAVCRERLDGGDRSDHRGRGASER